MAVSCLQQKLVSPTTGRFTWVQAHRPFCKVGCRAFIQRRKSLPSSENQGCGRISASKDDLPSTSPGTSSATPSTSSNNTTRNTATLVAPSNDATPSKSPGPISTEACTTNGSSTTVITSNSNSSNGSATPTTPPSADPPASTPLLSGGAETGLLASVGFGGGLLLLVVAGTVFRAPIRSFLEFFVSTVEQWGPLGYVAYGVMYTGLEVLAVPAIPLTMTAGVIFGPATGTIIVSVSATAAATLAFLIARYVARERVLKFAEQNPKFAAIDRAIGQDSLKVVTLLRLSPLLPLAISNYLYGLTSVDLPSYVLGSFIGMLPGTYAYVSAGHLGKAVLTEGEGMLSVEAWQVGVGIIATVLAVGFIGRLAKNALDDASADS